MRERTPAPPLGPDDVAKLGRAPDPVVAKDLNITPRQVFAARRRLKIMPYCTSRTESIRGFMEAGWGVPAIAKAMNVSESAARNLIYRARRQDKINRRRQERLKGQR